LTPLLHAYADPRPLYTHPPAFVLYIFTLYISLLPATTFFDFGAQSECDVRKFLSPSAFALLCICLEVARDSPPTITSSQVIFLHFVFITGVEKFRPRLTTSRHPERLRSSLTEISAFARETRSVVGKPNDI
jgi:hypothetical protein